MTEIEKEKYLRVTDLIRKKAKEILPKGSTVTLFGSRARGDFRDDSDWDLHILVPGPEKLSWDVISDFSYPFESMGWDINEMINPIVHSYAGWKTRWFFPLYKNIEKEGILL